VLLILKTIQKKIKNGSTRISSSNTLQRFDYLVEICKGKRVLHLGCADYPFTTKKLSMDALLYEKIAHVAQVQVGVDNNMEGIETLRRLGYKNLYVADLENALEIIPEGEKCFDVVVAGEIIEHLSNPGLFLDSIKKILGDGKLVLTIVNAYCLFRIVWYLFHLGIEYVHPDHVYYFSISTLKGIAIRHGYTVEDLKFYPIGRELHNAKGIPWYFWLLNRLSYWPLPFFADGIMILLSVRRDQGT